MTAMRSHLVRGIAVALACLCAACAGNGRFDPSPDAPGSVRRALTPAAAAAMIDVGKSTRAEVTSALGKALVIPFDSGYEVWVYRWPGPDKTTRAATELVLLFSPAGQVAKLRVRRGYQARE